MDPLTPLPNVQPERRWYRQDELVWAGRSMMVLVLVVIGVFYFGIICGIGGPTVGKGQVAALGFAGILAVLGWFLVRSIRHDLKAAGLSPDRAERGTRYLLAVLGMVMIFLGTGGLLYVMSLFDPTPIRWELRLEPLAHGKALTAACVVYILTGIFLVARGVRASREERS
jgi:hypothetical protein